MPFQKGSIINVGRKASLETRRKMSLSMRGKPHGPLTEEHKEKLRIARTGRTHTKETKERMRLIHLGHKQIPLTEGQKKKLSFSHTGKKLSEETKRKIGDSHRGEKSYLWKGGITPENVKVRNSIEMRLWRKACFERDSFTCQKYKIKGGKLEVHHINNFADFPELRTSISNGITLSVRAHTEFHHTYGKRNNTIEQLLEFLSKII